MNWPAWQILICLQAKFVWCFSHMSQSALVFFFFISSISSSSRFLMYRHWPFRLFDCVAIVNSIGHFRVPKTLTFKMRLGAQPFLWKWVSFAWEWKMISVSKAEHLPSFWNRGPGELRNGLFKTKLKYPYFQMRRWRGVRLLQWLQYLPPGRHGSYM